MSESKTPQSLVNLSDAVHQRSRLAILAVLYELSKADFRLLHKSTGLTEGNLGRHIQVLEAAGLVYVHKGYLGRKPQTIIEISPEGVLAMEEEIRVLKEFVTEMNKHSTASSKKKAGGRSKKNKNGIIAPAPLKG